MPHIQVTDLRRRNNPGRTKLARRATGAAALTVAASLAAFAAAGAESNVTATPTSVAPATAAAHTVGSGVDSYAAVVDRVAPAVVTVRSTRRVRQVEQSPFATDPFFRRFFGGEEDAPGAAPPGRRQGGLGSGVMIREDGYILTNHHVIDGADDIRIELSDRRSLKATVVGSDAPSDLAVLKVEGSGFPTVPLGDSDQVRVGDVVLALGNPMGVGQAVTMGIVSAKGRATGLGDGSFEDFLQTDAPINQGNSGGALVNTRGELVGINSQILSPSGGNIGIGFAIPAKMASAVMNSLLADGRVHRGKMGVTVQSVTPELAQSLRLNSVGGALVSNVESRSAADKAGLRRGDVITAVDGAAVADSNVLRNRIAGLKPETRTRLSVVRDGREQTLTVTLDELSSARSADEPQAEESNSGAAGLSVQPLTRELADRLKIDGGSGLIVTDVDPSGSAAEAGFRRGDVIEEVDGAKVESAEALRAAIEQADTRPALILVRRDSASLYLTLTLG